MKMPLPAAVRFAIALWLAMLAPHSARAEEAKVRTGEVRFEPTGQEEHAVPEPFRLPASTFSFQQIPQPQSTANISLSLVTFPSPVVTAEVNNNTVHCEYFRPARPGKYPACVVLHILGGDFPLARLFASNLAQHGVAALFVHMPYYGDRRQPGSSARMISTDPQATVRGMIQAVKDIRYAAAWLAAQDEVDPQQLGIFGISLGGITASLAAAAEPRFNKVCPVLAGGNLSVVLRDSQEKHLAAARQQWLAQGHSLDELTELMKTVDPCSYRACLQGRKILMLNALHDEIIPRACTDSLWDAFGRPSIEWYNCGHYTAVLHVLDALDKSAAFFSGEPKKTDGPASSVEVPLPKAE
ncbi:MAG TPA: alpha/beta hydrolase family protein [Pirellulales bacterium]|jgi:cephalosporin-C deacetylase-like acetyl esterase|nr:alpha/beta hydrolase family protein [Pirellulales bacterium]